MKNFLLIYDPASGELIAEAEFEDSAVALRERFRVERERAWEGRRLDRDVEVVVIWANSRETLRWTHARYFQTAAEMAREAALSLGSMP